MVRNTVIASLLASSAVALAATTPAHAGETERAREAISAADARIHTAESLGAGVELPAATATAHAALATAREHFADGHRDEAIQDAIRASALADTAIGEIQRRKIADRKRNRACNHRPALHHCIVGAVLVHGDAKRGERDRRRRSKNAGKTFGPQQVAEHCECRYDCAADQEAGTAVSRATPIASSGRSGGHQPWW